MTAELRRMATLGRLTAEAAAKLRLTLRWYAVLPDLNDTEAPVNRVRLLFSVDDTFGMDDATAELEAALAGPAHDPEAAAAQDRRIAEEAQAMARRLIDPNAGIL